MLPKIHRLNQKEDFQKVLKKGKMFHSPLLALSVLKVEGTGKKIGIIVSNKVSKKAVIRNKIRRILRVAAKDSIANMSQGTNAVFLVKPKAAETITMVKNEALNLLSKC